MQSDVIDNQVIHLFYRLLYRIGLLCIKPNLFLCEVLTRSSVFQYYNWSDLSCINIVGFLLYARLGN